MRKITNKDLKEIGVSREMYNCWYDIMNQIMIQGLIKFSDIKQDNGVIVINGYNIISNFVNKKFIQTEVFKDDRTYLQIRYNGSINSIVKCVFEVCLNPTI